LNWKRILTLVSLTAAISTVAAVSTLAVTSGGSNTPAPVDEQINGDVVRSDEDIGSDDPGIVHNVEIPDDGSVEVEDSPTLEGPDNGGEELESMDQTDLSLTDQDKATIIRLSLERALVAKEIPDYALWHAGKNIVVLSTDNLDVAVVPELPNIDLIIIGTDDIQIKADAEGDFMYLRFGEPNVGDAGVQVDLGNWWAVGKDSDVQHLSGGFFTLEYQRVSGEWVGTVLAVALS